MMPNLTPKLIVAQMKAALPKEAWVYKRWFSEGYVIQNGWFGDYALIMDSGWYYCFKFGTLDTDCSFHGNWYCYGGGWLADPGKLAKYAWDNLRK